MPGELQDFRLGDIQTNPPWMRLDSLRWLSVCAEICVVPCMGERRAMRIAFLVGPRVSSDEQTEAVHDYTGSAD